ncbi:MAG: hypothetical protein AB7Q01_15395, partial [Gammaproteobacteria bacterium]
ALVPLVILVTAMAALPLRRSREWAWLAVAALPLGALTLVVTTPYQLVGLIDIAVQQYAHAAGIPRPEPWRLRWMLFLEGGGRWVMPVVFALVGFAFARGMGSMSEPAQRGD